MNRKRILTRVSSIRCARKYQFNVAWAAVPHPDKAWKGGEDAIFASKNVLTVADGVSGWSKLGIDAGIYARKLISHIKTLLQSEFELYYIEHPDELALKAVQLTEEKGSSTLSIITVHPVTGILRSFHVGDSIYGIFKRNGSYILAQQHQSEFDTPFQVYGGKINQLSPHKPPKARPSDIFKGQYNQFGLADIQDNPILLASDGLWDNLHLNEIKETLSNSSSGIVEKSGYLLQRALYHSQLTEYESPYYHKAMIKGIEVEKGGKLDDISIVLAEIICIET